MTEGMLLHFIFTSAHHTEFFFQSLVTVKKLDVLLPENVISDTEGPEEMANRQAESRV
jgi:hypothetical protein